MNQRLGFRAIANDLNPVAYLITKATVEIPSLFKDKNPVHLGSPNKLHYQNAEDWRRMLSTTLIYFLKKF